MTYFNHSGGGDFNPAGALPSESTWAHGQVDGRGHYYPVQTFPELSDQIQRSQNGELEISEVDIDAYQAWCESGWKAQHATYSAADRFSQKGQEETDEVVDAWVEYRKTGDESHLVEELGDVLWVATALASNAKASVSDALKKRFFDYLMGTKVIGAGGGQTEPAWYDAVAELSVKRGSLQLVDISQLFARTNFVPQASAAMNLEGDETISLHEQVTSLEYLIVAAAFQNRQQYDEEGGPSYLSEAGYRQLSSNVGEVIAEAYLRVAAAGQVIGSSLPAIVAANIAKITERIKTNTIDKTDGERPSTL